MDTRTGLSGLSGMSGLSGLSARMARMTRLLRLASTTLLTARVAWAAAPTTPTPEHAASPASPATPPGAAPAVIALWPQGAPGALGTEPRDRPTITAFRPSVKANGAAVIVFPGGGYWFLAEDHEGVQVARWLNGQGITAFVLKYRHAPVYQHPIPMGDAQRAIRWVRAHAAEYQLAPDRIGVWGFSAGGHLAATVSTRFDPGDPRAADVVDRASSRPDFAILAYPVISLVAPYAHRGSAEALLGRDADPRWLEDLSAEKRVTASTPPTFLFHTNEDSGVPPENSIAYYLALRANHVPAELHIYEKGEHGVGLAPADPILSTWAARLSDWFKTRGLLSPPAACVIATQGHSPVAEACRFGGIPAAKAKMRELVAAAKMRGIGFACDDCHQKDALTAQAAASFERLLKAVGNRR